MGRTAKYTDQDILDAALDLVAKDGAHAATVVAIAKRLGAPSGSIYHRFASRDLILAALWIRTVKRFQHGFLEALSCDEPLDAATRAVSHVLRWSAGHRREAKVLTLYRREDLAALWPDELGDELATLNDEVKGAVTTFASAHFGHVDPATLGKAQFALIDIPYAAVRYIIRGEQPPPWLESATIAASMAVLASEEPTG